MNLFDQIVLLATGIVAIYLLWRFYNHFRKTNSKGDIYYIVGFAVLLVSGLLLIAFDFSALENRFVVFVAYLIPAGISLGLVTKYYHNHAKWYLPFTVLGLLLIGITRLDGMEDTGRVVLPIFHSVAGLIIFLLPIVMVQSGRAPAGFVWVSVGGTLIGLGGIALAFLKSGKQLLFFSSELVFDILAPLLLLMSLAFAWGFMKEMIGDK